MELSSIIFGLVVTGLLFSCWVLNRALTISKSIITEQALKLNNITLRISKDIESFNTEATRLVSEKLELENQVEHLKSTITNLRRAERKHVATIKKLAGE